MEYIIKFGIGNISELCATLRLKKPPLPLVDQQLGNLPRPSETGRLKKSQGKKGVGSSGHLPAATQLLPGKTKEVRKRVGCNPKRGLFYRVSVSVVPL